MFPRTLLVCVFLLGNVIATATLRNFNKFRHSRTGLAVENSYIVFLKDGTSQSASLKALDELIVAQDEVKEVTHSEWKVINAYAAKLSGSALQFVLDDPNVAWVEEDAKVFLDVQAGMPSDQSPLDNGTTVESHALRDLVKRQRNFPVDFYGIDTGIRVTHAEFTGRARWGAVFIGSQADLHGHGTHTASTAAGKTYGIAIGASIIAVKVLGDDGGGTTTSVVSGVDFVTTSAKASSKSSVANMSLGGGISDALDQAVRNSIASGVLYTIAAGNSNQDASNTSPARVAEAVTVGAITAAKHKASFSNWGAPLDLWYYGVDIKGAWITSDTSTNVLSGTSMAAPGVAGIFAVGMSTYADIITTPLAWRNALVSNSEQGTSNTFPAGTTNRIAERSAIGA